jgi:hypothetical protein
MIATIVLLMIALITLGALSLQSFDFNRTQQVHIQSVQYASELVMVKQMLLALSTTYEVTDDEGTRRYPAVPLGANQGAIHTLPSLMLKPKNPVGKPYIYCPFGARSDQPLAESIDDGLAPPYNVATSVLAKNGRSLPYVTGSGVNTLDGAVILAYIISPDALTDGSVRCHDVVYDKQLQKFLAAGGRVATITDLEVEAVNLN